MGVMGNVQQVGYREQLRKHLLQGAQCGGEDTCVGQLCLCRTPGVLTGFYHPVVSAELPDNVVGGQDYQFRKLREEQTAGGFVHLGLVTLPGTDMLYVRKLWESITGVLSEHAMLQEVGSAFNTRSQAWARKCGAIVLTADSAHTTHRGPTACMVRVCVCVCVLPPSPFPCV